MSMEKSMTSYKELLNAATELRTFTNYFVEHFLHEKGSYNRLIGAFFVK